MIIHVEFDGTICPDARMVQPQTTPDEAVVAELRCYRSRGATIVVTSGRAGEAWSGGWKTRHAERLNSAYQMHDDIGRERGVEPWVETDFLPASHEKLAHLHLDVPFSANGPGWNRALCNAQNLARRIGCDGIVIGPASCRPGSGGTCTLVVCAIRVAGTLRRSAS